MKYETRKARQELANALEDLPDKFLLCRGLRHAFDVTKDFYVDRDVHVTRGDIRRELTCLRCGMQRIERFVMTIDQMLDKIGQTYIAPEGYVLKGVPRGVKPASIVHGVQYSRAARSLAEVTRLHATG